MAIPLTKFVFRNCGNVNCNYVDIVSFISFSWTFKGRTISITFMCASVMCAKIVVV